MPTLHWIGKDKVVNHHQEVIFRTLEHGYGFDGLNGQTAQVTNSGNKIIHGDNLEALKALLPEYEGRVKCIYIDPPYNTGNEGWVYNDAVNDPKIKKWLGDVVGKEGEDLSRHDKWLCMMFPRLKLLHKLLADDGVIFISIDDNEQANLKLICDEIFGNRNFVANVIWQKKYTVANDTKWLSENHDHILIYAINKEIWRPNRLERTSEMNERYRNPDNHPKGVWKSTPIYAKRTGSEKEQAFSFKFKNGVVWTPPKGTSPRFPAETLRQLDENNEIWFGSDGKAVPSRKTFLNELKISAPPTPTLWLHTEAGNNHEASEEIKSMNLDDSFTTPKPTRLIDRILKIATDKNAIVLDSFAGSGTTAHAVLNLNQQDGGNRKFILIELMGYADTITAERVKRVMQKQAQDRTASPNATLAFDYYALGEPLFDADNQLNENISAAKIADYIAYTESLKAEHRQNISKNPYFLGVRDNTGFYFHYQKNHVTALNFDFLATLDLKTEQYLIYADKCLLNREFMQKNNILFKKIPRDISRL